MEPLGKMNAIFPVVNEQINKRNKKVCSCLTRDPYVVLIASPPTSQLLDYDAARSKMNKLIAKPSEDPTKLPRVRNAPPSTFPVMRASDQARDIYICI